MTTLIVRYVGRRGAKPRLWTADSEKVEAQFKQRLRDTGERIAGFRVAQPAGVDRSTVSLRSRVTDEGTRTARGALSSINWLTFRLLDRHQHVRILGDEDKARLAEIDAVIAAKEAELKAIRTDRAEAVAEAWKRGQKIDISLLEEKANA